VSVSCFALSRHSRPEIQSFGSQCLLSPAPDVQQKLVYDRHADSTAILIDAELPVAAAVHGYLVLLDGLI
jgi:hypothetical protein